MVYGLIHSRCLTPIITTFAAKSWMPLNSMACLKQKQVASLMSVEIPFYLWCQLKAETGDVYPKPLKPQGPKCLIKDWDKFKRFVEANADKTQRELAELWEDDISARSISRAIKRIGFTRKKRRMVIENETKSNEESFKTISRS